MIYDTLNNQMCIRDSAKEIGCSKSTISRFISGANGTLTHEHVLKIARLFNVCKMCIRDSGSAGPTDHFTGRCGKPFARQRTHFI